MLQHWIQSRLGQRGSGSARLVVRAGHVRLWAARLCSWDVLGFRAAESAGSGDQEDVGKTRRGTRGGGELSELGATSYSSGCLLYASY